MAELGLAEKELAAIASVFKKKPAITHAIVFGSRAKGGCSQYADIDIAICGDIGFLEIEGIKCDLDELPLAYKFDVVSYERIKNPELRQHIDRVGKIIYGKGIEAGA